MQLTVGQKVAYPNQGPCVVETKEKRMIAGQLRSGYTLRVLGDNSKIFVPQENTDSVGLRPLISATQCRKLIKNLSEDFEPVSCDWKSRSREFAEKLQSGDIFQAADVLKKLLFLSHEKKLSFREQTLFEKAKFLILSEINITYSDGRPPNELEILNLAEAACTKHMCTQPRVMVASIR